MLKFIARNRGDVTENNQSSPVRFASIVKDEDKLMALHYQFKCRDYMQDQYVAARTGNKMKQIFDQTADGVNSPMNLRKVQMVISTSHDFNKLKSSLPLLNAFEEKLGLTPTKLTTVNAIGGRAGEAEYLYVEGPPRWLSTSVSFSIYTLLIRVLSMTNVGGTLEELLSHFAKEPYKDSTFVEAMLKEIDLEFFMRNVTKIRRNVSLYEGFDNNVEDMSTFAHNYSGIWGYTQYVTGGYRGRNSKIERLAAAGHKAFNAEYKRLWGTSGQNRGLLQRLGVNN